MYCLQCGKKVKREAKIKKGKGIRIYNLVMLMIYAVTLITCFICNLAVNKTLSWFYIVLCSLALTFCITNLPFMIKRYKLSTAYITCSLLIYLLLYICCRYTEGDWLYSIAYPITTVSLVFVGMILITIKLKINGFFKSAVISMVSGIYLVCINPLCNHLVYHKPFDISLYFNLYNWDYDIIANKIMLICLALSFVINIIVGMVFEYRKDE